jgi:hypothetical protein
MQLREVSAITTGTIITCSQCRNNLSKLEFVGTSSPPTCTISNSKLVHITTLTHTFTSLLQLPDVTTALGVGSTDDQGRTKANLSVPHHA